MAEDTKKKKAKKPATPSGPLTHPEIVALEKEGVPIPRTIQLAQAHGVQHPAIQFPKTKAKAAKTTNDAGKNPSAGYAAATMGANAGTPVSADPTDPAQYAANVLVQAGLPNTKSNEQLLEDQMTEEGMPGSEDNPLATSLKEPGSTSVNSDNVQEYPNLEEGATAEAQTLKQQNMKSIYDALLSGTATPNQYATGLAASQYEGSNPGANAAYATSFLKDTGEPETAFPAGLAAEADSGGGGDTGSTLGTDALSQAMGTNSFAGLNSVIPTSGSSLAANSLQSALAGLSSSPESSTLAANTTNAPGSPDQSNSQTQQTNVTPASQYQQALAALLPNIRPGTAQ